MTRRSFLLFIFILGLGFGLRICGLNWGLSTTKYFHFAAYHPDESETIKAIATLNPVKFDFKVDNYLIIRGTFQLYLTAAWIKIASVFGLVNINSSFNYYKKNPAELVKLYITGRSLSIFFGLLTIILVFFAAKLYYSSLFAGMTAAFLMAITPLHVIWSKYIGTDSILTFQALLMLYFSFYILKNADKKIYIFAGIVMGLAGATKYSILPLMFIPVVAHYLSTEKFLNKKLLLYLIFVPVGFIIGNPCSILYPRYFYDAMKYSSQILVTLDPVKNPLDSFGPQNTLIFYLITAPKYSFGIPLSLLFLCGIIFAFIKRQKIDILILCWLVIFYLFISLSSPWQSMRWQLPYVPLLCILSARFIFSVFQYPNKYLKTLIIAVTFFISFLTLFYSASYLKMMTGKDIRDESSEWIEQNIPEGKKIAVPDVYFWNPSIVMTLYWYREAEPFYAGIKKYKIIQTDWEVEKLKKEKPDYAILSDFEYYPILKLKNKYPHPELMPYLEKIMQSDEYKLIKKFEKKPELFGITTIGGFLPPELRMVNPTILIYEKN